MTQEALKELLEAVEAAIQAGDWKVDGACDPDLVIRRAKEALAQPEQEQPETTDWERVARVQNAKLMAMCDEPGGFENLREVLDRYKTQPERKPLTDEEILAVAKNHYNPHQRSEISFARAIEAAHNIKEKNT